MSIDAAPPPLPAQAPQRPTAQAHFGGPDRPAGALRDLLKAQIEATPSGGEILWVTYYFRDRELADALIAARRRGVRVKVAVEGEPRLRGANSAVIERLQRGLGPGLTVHRALVPGARLHAKIYAFSAPSPRVFVGSFNPSGDQPEDPAVLAEIGDQDRGHNLLVEFRDPSVVHEVREQADRIWRGRSVWRLAIRQNRFAEAGAYRLFYFPRLRSQVVEASLARIGRGDRVRAAISHVEPGAFTAQLSAAAKRGADVQLVVHDTERRVPAQVVTDLTRSGVDIRRYCHPAGLPMHAKFVVVERSGRRTAWFGSLNFNGNSQLLNQEILVRSREPALTTDFVTRFERIRREAEALESDPTLAEPPRLAMASLTAPHGLSVMAHTRACGAPAPAAPSGWFSVLSGWARKLTALAGSLRLAA